MADFSVAQELERLVHGAVPLHDIFTFDANGEVITKKGCPYGYRDQVRLDEQDGKRMCSRPTNSDPVCAYCEYNSVNQQKSHPRAE